MDTLVANQKSVTQPKSGKKESSSLACMGCGICASECPAKAIELKHSTDDQIFAKIDALLESAVKDD